jgi:hypothetical protein
MLINHTVPMPQPATIIFTIGPLRLSDTLCVMLQHGAYN